MQTVQTNPPSLATIFFTWFMLGVQSFGGGSSTFLLIHQVCVARGWLTEDEFVRSWALAQISPGINLLKFTVLVTHNLRGWRGVAAGVLGMLLPSGIVTVLMTAGFAQIRDIGWVKAATRGILPATIGLSLAMAAQMALPILKQSRSESPRRLGLHLGLIALAALLMGMNLVSPVVLLLGSGAVTILLHMGLNHRAKRTKDEMGEEDEKNISL